MQRSQAREIMRWSGSLPCQWARAAAHLEEASSGSDAHSCLAAWIGCGMRAQRLLGNFAEAAKDISTACKIDFDEQADEWLKQV